MDRREFFEKSGCGILGAMLTYFGLSMPLSAYKEHKKKMSRQEWVKKLLMEKMGKTEKEADAMIAEFEKKLPVVQEMCICKNCPTYLKKETTLGFCHPLVGKSEIITKEKGCICGSCPVYKKMKLTKGYYCTRGAEMEQNIKKKEE